MKTLIIISLLFAGCYTLKTIPLKNQYQDAPFQATSTNKKDIVWDKLIDLFAQTGLSIKIIDRSSGLIISERAALSWTHEDKKGNLRNPNAYIVLPKLIDINQNVVPINNLTGEWNVRIKDDNSGGTTINVNMVNLQKTMYGYKTAPYPVAATGVSTGVFEKIIFEFIK